jgi:hypothetical protein
MKLHLLFVFSLMLLASAKAQSLDSVMMEEELPTEQVDLEEPKSGKAAPKAALADSNAKGAHQFLNVGADAVWPPIHSTPLPITRNFFLDPRKQPPAGVAAVPIIMAKKEPSVQERLNKALQSQMNIWEAIQQTATVKAVVIDAASSFMLLSNGQSLVQGETLELTLSAPDEKKKGKNAEPDKVRLRLLRLLPNRAEIRLESINGTELFRSESPVWVWQID